MKMSYSIIYKKQMAGLLERSPELNYTIEWYLLSISESAAIMDQENFK